MKISNSAAPLLPKHGSVQPSTTLDHKSSINDADQSNESSSLSLLFSGSKNVPRVILYNFVDGASFSVWQAQVLQVLVFHIGGNTTVGWVNSASGLTQVLSALIAGYAGDKIHREYTCRVAAVAGLAAIGLTAYSTYLLYIPLYYVSSGLWGCYMGLSNPASEALFADSVPSGRRASIYSFKWIVQIMCYMVGYFVSLVMFLTMGNKWDNHNMQLVIYAGLGLHPLSMLLLLTIRDKHGLSGAAASAVGAEKPSTVVSSKSMRTTQAFAERERSQSFKEIAFVKSRLLAFAAESQEKTPPAQVDGQAAAVIHTQTEDEERIHGAAEGEAGGVLWCVSHHRYTPYFICFGDFLLACGSGMTLRYLPLFFVDNYKVSPVELMVVFMTISVATSLFAKVALLLSDRVGRIRTMLIFRGMGTNMLIYLALARGDGANVWVMLAVFVTRNAFMNATLGMSRSMIMDCVAKEHRAKWSAIESFSSFTWSGSALLGGYLADAHGYRFSFLITAVLHYVATAVLVPAYFSSRKLEAATMSKMKVAAEDDPFVDEARDKTQSRQAAFTFSHPAFGTF